MKVHVVWGVEYEPEGKRVRAFTRVETLTGQVMGQERQTAYRLATYPEQEFMIGSREDRLMEYAIARSFFPKPEQLEGEGGPIPPGILL